ncbi:hypothetical protein RFI_28382 [Reticulomyxa filosa]|uniref:Uncharacterized protein n=1 Tax=Reticulomyxa filosa TaxID=46433 RepID=X6M7J2_RETFI|nr:hypothetical protein RFI_28382 [Reticulomyxa filosa]|eukprot:ETO09005.1 hypothetical protein RFI_28382 [Reticulomyxa filosa]
MKHLSWIIRHLLENKSLLDEMNVAIGQIPLTRSKKIMEGWLKRMHDSVNPYVVAEVIILYIETCVSDDAMAGNPRYAYCDFATFLTEYVKQSIDSAYINVKELYEVASTLKELSNPSLNDNAKKFAESSKTTLSFASSSKLMSPLTKQKPLQESAISPSMSRDDVSPESEKTPEAADDAKSKHAALKNFFRDENNQKEWWEFISEIEMLFNDDSKISVALWEEEIFDTIPKVNYLLKKSYFI